MISDEKIIEAIKILIKACKERDCKNCPVKGFCNRYWFTDYHVLYPARWVYRE